MSGIDSLILHFLMSMRLQLIWESIPSRSIDLCESGGSLAVLKSGDLDVGSGQKLRFGWMIQKKK